MDSQNKSQWIRCRYFSFWDVPRGLLLLHQSRYFLLDSPFEEEPDDYRPTYYVWELDAMKPEQAERLSWTELEARKIKQWADIPVGALEFDPNRQRQGDHFYVRLRFKKPEQSFPEAILFPE